MKPSETTAVYTEQARARRIMPHEEEGRLWHTALKKYDVKDVRLALDAWNADTAPGKDGVPRGKWLPSPAELIPVIDKILHDRETQAAIPKFLVRWGCPTCRNSVVGFLRIGDDVVRRCQSPWGPNRKGLPAGQVCGATMQITTDERPKPCPQT